MKPEFIPPHHLALYNGERVLMDYIDPKDQFRRACQRIADNGAYGYVVTPKGEVFVVEPGTRRARPLSICLDCMATFEVAFIGEKSCYYSSVTRNAALAAGRRCRMIDAKTYRITPEAVEATVDGVLRDLEDDQALIRQIVTDGKLLATGECEIRWYSYEGCVWCVKSATQVYYCCLMKNWTLPKYATSV